MRKVSIIPRGLSLGVTFSAPESDRFNYREPELLAKIKVALGGRAAEELVYGETTTGAESDIQQLTEIARQMVGRWGMSGAVGPVAVIPRDGSRAAASRRRRGLGRHAEARRRRGAPHRRGARTGRSSSSCSENRASSTRSRRRCSSTRRSTRTTHTRRRASSGRRRRRPTLSRPQRGRGLTPSLERCPPPCRPWRQQPRTEVSSKRLPSLGQRTPPPQRAAASPPSARSADRLCERVRTSPPQSRSPRWSFGRRSPSQPDDQVADLGGLGEEWVVAGVEFHDAGCSTGELALQVGRGALVLRADEVRRGHVLPGR